MVDALLEQVVAVDALGAADDLAVALRERGRRRREPWLGRQVGWGVDGHQAGSSPA